MAVMLRTSYEEFMALPDDGMRHELVRGEVLAMPPPKGGHGGVEMALGGAIERYLHNRALALGWQESEGRAVRNRLVGYLGGGEDGIRFALPDDDAQVRGLDLLYLSPEQYTRLQEEVAREYIPEVPVLVAEVISPSETVAYRDQKVDDLLAGGAQVVWLLYRNTRRVWVFGVDGVRIVPPDGTLDGGEVLPGFSVTLANLFV